MVGRGALWTPEEIGAMAEYLAQIRGPSTPIGAGPVKLSTRGHHEKLVAQLLSNGISRRDFVRRRRCERRLR
jgi:hypothetical protein